MPARSSNPTPRRRKPAEATPAVESTPAEVKAAEAQAEQDAQADQAPTSAYRLTLDDLVTESKDKDSALVDAKTVMDLVPRIARGLQSLSESTKEARSLRLAIAPLIMQVRLCFTYLGRPDEHGAGQAYKQSFAKLIVRQIAEATGIAEVYVRADLDSIRTNVLNGEGRKDAAIVARLHAAGEVSDDDWAAWEEALKKADGRPRKVKADDVPEAVASALRTSYKQADQTVPDNYLTTAEAAERKAEKDARTSNRPDTSGPANPAKDIGRVASELIATAAGHPDLLADAIWRLTSHLSDVLVGVPGEAPSLTEVPNRVQRVIPALDTFGKLAVFTAAAIQTPPQTTKEALSEYRYVQTPEAEPVDILAVLKDQMAAPTPEAPEAPEAGVQDAK